MIIDFLLRNGTVIDGSGGSRYVADVAISGENILRVGNCQDLDAKREIDIRGMVVAPGFIDTHSHDDAEVLTRPDMTAKVSQGVTTVVVGNCGLSAGPTSEIGMGYEVTQGRYFEKFSDYLEAMRAQPANVNVAALVGHSSLRGAVLSDLGRAATEDETRRMQDMLREAMVAGAIGLSSGTAYPPAQAATPMEMQGVCKPLTEFGGVFTTHMRDEADGVLDSIDETGRIGRALNVRTLISHHKCAGVANHGRSVESLAAIDRWRDEIPLGLDVYPYAATSTVLLAPRVRISHRTLITICSEYPALVGRDVSEVAAEWGCSIEALCDRVGKAGATYFSLSEEDVGRILRHPASMIGSDGVPAQDRPHPRLWGTFPRVLGHYCRDLGLFGLEEAVHKMTGLPAAFFEMHHRGQLKPGWFADITVFSPEAILDLATFDDPTRPSRGIELVFLNGQLSWDDGHVVPSRAGRVLQGRRDAAGADDHPPR